MYEKLYETLIEKIKLYHPSNDYSMVEKACKFAEAAHKTQFRKSGEPYIIHPLSVAIILAELELDFESITAGILHDVIEDTDYTYDDIANMFSKEIADLVNGVTKLDELEKSKNATKERAQADNFLKLFFAMTKDIRVILIKIADRLHNLRTLKFMPPEKRIEIAQESLDIYAPIANRLGISKIRYDLEDLSFKYLHNEAYLDLADKIIRKQSQRQEYVSNICKELREKLSIENIEGEVQGRPKHFFSIYKKMHNDNKTLEEIYDLFAVRVIVEDIPTCYRVLGIVHEKYKPVPGRFKDYISTAKINMYQSIHSTLIGPEGEPFEIQIRTHEMHRTAEYGIAAHWKYKESKNGNNHAENEEDKLTWLRNILEWQKDYLDSTDFFKALKKDLNIYSENVYCFSPKGKVVALMNGANTIDFAYAIHSSVGNQMNGARVDGKMVPIEYVLKNGERVEILTSKNSTGPSVDWLKIVKTNQAKSKINQWFKKANKEDNIKRGKDVLEQEAKKRGVNLSELISENRGKNVLAKFSFLDWDSLCAAVGHGSLKEAQVINRLYDEYQKDREKNISRTELANLANEKIEEMNKKNEERKKEKVKNKEKELSKKISINIKGLGDVLYFTIPKCCSPLPGDEILAFNTHARGIKIHSVNCKNMLRLNEDERNRLMKVSWNIPEKGSLGFHFIVGLTLEFVEHENNAIIMSLYKLFSDEKINVTSFNNRKSKNKMIIDIYIEITGKEQLESISNKIRSLKNFLDIHRINT